MLAGLRQIFSGRRPTEHGVVAAPYEVELAQPEDTGLGFMEYFDWLASCSDEELHLLARTYGTPYRPAEYDEKGHLSAEQRDAMGRQIWEAM